MKNKGWLRTLRFALAVLVAGVSLAAAPAVHAGVQTVGGTSAAASMDYPLCGTNVKVRAADIFHDYVVKVRPILTKHGNVKGFKIAQRGARRAVVTITLDGLRKDRVETVEVRRDPVKVSIKPSFKLGDYGAVMTVRAQFARPLSRDPVREKTCLL